MKTRLMTLAILGLVLPLTASADEKPAAVKEIDVKALKIALARDGNVTKPTKITSTEELAKAITDEAAQTAIKKEVDFATQYLLLFNWGGSGQDKLTFATKEGKNEVVFVFKGGLTRDFRPHVHLFVLPKDATFQVTGAPR
jgi:hypothetical protein